MIGTIAWRSLAFTFAVPFPFDARAFPQSPSNRQELGLLDLTLFRFWIRCSLLPVYPFLFLTCPSFCSFHQQEFGVLPNKHLIPFRKRYVRIGPCDLSPFQGEPFYFPGLKPG